MSFASYLRPFAGALLATSLLFNGLSTQAATGPVAADLLVVIDESGSMSGEQRWIAEVAAPLDQSLQAYGVGDESQSNLFGLIGFGDSRVVPRSLLMGGELLGNAAAFTQASSGLRVNGGTEDGWRGIEYALDTYPRRSGAVVNVILVTDEDRDNTNSAITFNTVLEKLQSNRALLNAVVNVTIRCADNTSALGMDSTGVGYVADGNGGFTTCTGARAVSGAGATIAHYAELAVRSGGAVWNLNFLRSGGHFARSFSNALLSIKVEEILNQRPANDLNAVAQAVPNPAVPGQLITLNGAQSFHQTEGRNIVSWEWDLDNDGVYDANGPIVTTRFTQEGQYPVRLRVTDDSEIPLVDSIELMINLSSGLLKPTAVAGGPYLFCPQDTHWWLDGSASINPDDGRSQAGGEPDRITEYAWDLNNDLDFSDARGARVDATAQLRPLGVGDHLVRLRVTDNSRAAFAAANDLSDVAVTQVRIRDESDLLCSCMSDLAARPKNSKIQLTWTDTGAHDYVVYRSVQHGGPYEVIATTDNRYSTYLDLGLPLDVPQYYVVAARARNGLEICRSREVTATPAVRRPNAANRAPVITSTPITTVDEGQLYRYALQASDPDARDVIEFNLALAPVGMAIDASSGVITWTPTNAQVGQHAVTVQVSDTLGAFTQQSFVITVQNVNQAPAFVSEPLLHAVEETVYQYQAQAVDPDIADQLVYTLMVAPAGMSIHSQTGLISWMPAIGQAGSHAVEIRVEDSAGASAQQPFIVTVEERNLAPSIISTPVVNAVVGVEYRYPVQADDPNAADTLTFALGAFPNGMVIDTASGVVTWVPQANQVGVHDITVVVSDNRNASSAQAFQIRVTEPNLAPVFSTDALPDAVENVGYVAQVEAVDPNVGDQIEYALVFGPQGLVLDAQSGQINWLPGNQQAGNHVLVVRATDNHGLFSEVTLSLRVLAVNDAPVIVSNPVTTAQSQSRYQYQVAIEDPDAGDSHGFSLAQSPDGMTISASGLIEWTPPANAASSYSVQVVVVDAAGARDSQTFTLQVLNRAPVISSVPPPQVQASQRYVYQVVAQDDDGDTLRFTLQNAPGGMTIDSASGLLQWQTQLADHGQHAFVVSVADNRGGVATQSISLMVQEQEQPNQPPVITSVPSTQATVGHAYAYSLVVSDPDGDPLTLVLSEAPAGMTMTPFGDIHWIPTESQLGAHAVGIRVTDDQGAFVSQAFVIEVQAEQENEPAEPLNGQLNVSPQFVTVGQPVVIQLNHTGGTGAVVVELRINGESHALDQNGRLTVTGTVTGRNDVIVQLRDELTALELSGSFYVAEQQDTAPPVVALHAPGDGQIITAPTTIVATVTDDNPGYYQLYVAERGKQDWRLIGEGNGNLSNAAAGELDPSLLLNGQYTLLLRAFDASGNRAETSTTFAVEGDMKVGHFSLTFEDVSIPVSGIPIVVNRTYDSRQAHQRLDFGYGWSIDYQNVRVHSNRTVGLGWQLNQYGSAFSRRYCVEPQGSPIVSVTLPDGEVHKFVAEASPSCTNLVPTVDVNLVFRPMAGTHSQLQQTDYGVLRAVGGDLIDLGDIQPVDPKNFRLTTQDGTVYELGRDFGIRRIIDTAGNTLTYSAAGITHSAGVGIQFVRDSQQRITEIRLPNGENLQYRYDAAGNLVGFSDQLENEAQYQYLQNPAHYLRDIIDPRGVRVARNEYDDAGRLVAHIDAEGNRIEMTHDVEGRSKAVRDRLGNTTVYVYNDRGDVLQETNSLGEIITRSYDQYGNMLSETDALGNTRSWTYDSRGNLLTETDALGRTRSYQYDSRGNVIRVTEPDGSISSQTTFNATTGAPTQITDALGNVQSFAYSTSGELTQLTDALGQVKRLAYDSRGNLLREELPDGAAREYTYDAMGNLLTEADVIVVNGSTQRWVTRYEYDAKGQVIRTENPLGEDAWTEYDAAGNEVASIDALGRRTEYDYDSHGQQIRVRNPDGTQEEQYFDRNGNLIQSVDRLGRSTFQVWDSARRLLEVRYPDGSTEQKSYNSAGRLVLEVDGNGHERSFEYDAAGNLIAEVDALGQRTEFSYDSQGRRISMKDARGNLIQFQHDAMGRPVRTVFADGSFTEVSYDALSRKTAEVDANGLEKRFEYDAQGRLLAVIDALGQRTEYGYDLKGNRTTQTDANGHITRWGYDALGRVLSRTLPAGQSESFTYDAVGNRLTHTDFNGNTTRHQYDLLNRLVRTDYADGVTELTQYTAASLIASVDVQCAPAVCALAGRVSGETRYQYDLRDRLVRVELPGGLWIEYDYDNNGNRTLLRSAHQQVQYEYDALNRLVRVGACQDATCDAMDDTVYAYDSAGNRISTTHANGSSSEYVYDVLNRLVELRERDALGNLMVEQVFTLGAAGHRLAVSELDDRQIQYQYDGLYRLVEERVTDPRADRITRYTYDAVGNRLSETISCTPSCMGELQAGTTTYAYDANDRLLQEQDATGTTAYSYDANGNTLSTSSAGDTVQYRFNSRNQLVEASGATSVAYRYSVDGSRVAQTQNGSTRTFLVDANRDYAQVIEERTSSGELLASYVMGDQRISQRRGNQQSIYHSDGLGSIRALTSATGAQTDSYVYSAFGLLEHQQGNSENAFLFAGEQYDADLGQYYLRARNYDPRIGRLISQDSYEGRIGEPLTLHKYMYVHADPVNNVDPSGMMAIGMTMGFSMQISMRTLAFSTAGLGLAIMSSQTFNGPFRVWDAVAVSEFNARKWEVASYSASNTQVEEREWNGKTGPQEHHPIPIYLCGVESGQRMVKMAHNQHVTLHAALATVELALTLANQRADTVVFGRHRSEQVAGLGRTREGRAAIASGIELAYMPFWHYGAQFGTTLSDGFYTEKAPFINGKTSWPTCRR